MLLLGWLEPQDASKAPRDAQDAPRCSESGPSTPQDAQSILKTIPETNRSPIHSPPKQLIPNPQQAGPAEYAERLNK